MPARRIAFAIVAGLAVLAAPAAATAADAPTATGAALGSPHVIASGLNVPWGIAFLPDGDALVAERATGRIMRIPQGGGTARPSTTVPASPNFGRGRPARASRCRRTTPRDHLVYAYYTAGADNRIVRFRLGAPAPAR